MFSINQGGLKNENHQENEIGKDSLLIKPNNLMKINLCCDSNTNKIKGKDNDRSKAKIIDDLFCSTNVNAKQSINPLIVLNKKNSNDDNKKKPPLSLSKHLDELFPVESNKNSKNNQSNQPEASLKDKYIDPNMIIEEEQQKDFSKGLASSYDIHQMETIKVKEDGTVKKPPLVIDFSDIFNSNSNENKNFKKESNDNKTHNIFPSSFDFNIGNNNNNTAVNNKEENKDQSNNPQKGEVKLEDIELLAKGNNIIQNNPSIQEPDKQNQQSEIDFDAILNFANVNNKNEKAIASSKIPSFNIDSNSHIIDRAIVSSQIKQNPKIEQEKIKANLNNNCSVQKPKNKNIEESTFMLMKSKISERKKIDIIKEIKPNEAFASKPNNQNHPSPSVISNKDLIRKRNGVLNQNYFSSIILYKEKTPPNIHHISSEYQIKVKENYDLIKHQYNLIYINTPLEEKKDLYAKLLDQSEDVNNTYNLYNQISFKTMFNYPHNKSTIYFEYFRLFQTNGNSFYYCFMFSYIEQMLIYQKQHELFALFVDILRLSECNKYAYESINMKEAIAFFAVISDLIQSCRFTLAYQLFIISFMNQNTRDDVASLLVLYMKWCLFAMQYDDIYDDSLNKTQGAPKLNYHRDDYQIDNILKAETEPEKLVLESVPFIFNVKLKIYWVDGDLKKSKLEMNEFSNYNKETITIHLGYFYSGYTCVYLKGIYDYNQIFKEVNQNFINNTQSISISDKRRCSECSEESNVVDINSCGKGVCLNCLTKAVDIVIAQRTKMYILESFQNIECKCNKLL